ncbi:MAG: hypothetical protein NPMRD1_60045 [Nitrosopumilales archaeon]|nr:MAG: hypothetical protein NPMRD1_60045 [Nitrosopumilales archaeon]
MASLFSMKSLKFAEKDWIQISHEPVIYESIVDNAPITIYDTNGMPHRMTFRKGGKLHLEKIEEKFRFHWESSDLK